MFRRLFTDHPESVGESYAAHFRTASHFGVAMIGGGLACLVHAACPAAFETTGSRTVTRLHSRLVAGRAARRAAHAESQSGWVI